MHVKPKKCVLIPTRASCTPHLVECIRSWLVSHVPAWANFKISSKGKYLGFMLGPGADESQWAPVIAKYVERASLIASAHTAACVTAFRYNSRAIPLLNYLAQLLPLPVWFWKLEKLTLHRLLHVPFNSFTLDAMLNLAGVCGPGFLSAAAAGTSAMVRTALATVTSWPSLRDVLHDSAMEHLPMERSLCGLWWPRDWLSHPVALQLEHAAALFTGNSVLHPALAPHAEQLKASAAGCGRSSLQRMVYGLVKPALHPDRLCAVCAGRMRALLPAHADVITDLRVALTLSKVKKLSPHVAMCVIKTFCNAWCTSHRFHEQPILGCVFGCHGETDPLAHYLHCQPLWSLASQALGFFLPISAIGRLAVLRNDVSTLQGIFMAFHMYHAVKVGHKEVLRLAFESLDFSTTQLVALSSSRAALALIRPGP